MAATMASRLWLLGRAKSFRPLLSSQGIRNLQTSCRSLAAYDAEFESAKQKLNSLKEDPGNEVKLQMYALFKQATVGKCNTPKPGMLDMVGKFKWNAWTDLGSMSQDDAQMKYIDIVKDLAAAEGVTDEPVKSKDSGQHFETLAVSKYDGIYKITLNRPNKKNAINFQMYEDWINALKEAGEDDSITLAVVTGAGDYYCSGNDLGNFMNIPPDGIKAMAEDGGKILKRFVAAFIDFPKPLISLVNGPAVGVSVTMLGLFEAVYASDRATFSTPFTQLGQTAEGCSSYTFPKLMGNAKASELLLFNKKISAAEAFNRGLVTEVIPDNTFSKDTEAKIKTYAKLPKQSLQKSKVLIRDAERQVLHDVNKRECEVLVGRWQSEECMMAVLNFFQSKSS